MRPIRQLRCQTSLAIPIDGEENLVFRFSCRKNLGLIGRSGSEAREDDSSQEWFKLAGQVKPTHNSKRRVADVRCMELQ